MNSTQVNEIGAITPDLSIVDGQITTTSTQVAAHFGKAHRSVLLAIRRLECSEEFRLHNFVQSSYLNEQGKEQPCYRLTRDGFVFLAMGFTGKEAAQWKEAYITAFNNMEQALLAKTMRPANPAIDYDRISPTQAQDLKELVHSIVDAKVQGFAETWARLQRKFRVNSYLELPASRFEEARNYLRSKLPTPITLPRLELTMRPPAIGSYRYDSANPYPHNGRTIEVAKSIVTDIGTWALQLPAGAAQRDLLDATDTLYSLLVSGWTEVDEALGQLSTAMHYLKRWQGRGGRLGNVA